MFAVVLGFLANEWRADVQADGNAREALLRIEQEIEDNIATLETVLPYHESVLGRISDALVQIDAGESPDRGVFLDVIPELLPRGMQEPGLSRIAWDYAEQRGQMDPLAYVLVSEIANVYSTQESGVESTWRVIVERFVGQIESVSEGDLLPRLILMQYAFQELVAQERFLLELQQNVLSDVRRATD